MSHFDDDYSADSLMRELSKSLGEQVTSEMENKEQERRENLHSPDEEPGIPLTKRNEKKPVNKKKIIGIVVGVLAAICLLVVITGNYFLDRLNYEKGEELVTESGEPLQLDENADVKPADSNVINVLLIGEEKINDGTRGRSESMMIATINQKQKSLKLTSIMRDCYVSIPGHRDNKLNAAYNQGGGALLAATIEQNFKVHLDGYVRVDFDAFETIIDKLGGVEIELSEEEARYLNRTNYISNRANRTMVAGVNNMNGNQALGYSRVRYVKEVDGERDDFGRTARQRRVLSCIFEKYKNKNLIEMIGIANEILPYITTNLTKTDIISYISAFVATGSTELETFRIPMKDAYYGAKRDGAGSVLVLNFELNNAALQEFIYGHDENAESVELDDAQGEVSIGQ
ncbi:MAG: LCP family protein [Acetivibrio ethanolgignens]